MDGKLIYKQYILVIILWQIYKYDDINILVAICQFFIGRKQCHFDDKLIFCTKYSMKI